MEEADSSAAIAPRRDAPAYVHDVVEPNFFQWQASAAVADVNPVTSYANAMRSCRRLEINFNSCCQSQPTFPATASLILLTG